MTKHPVAVRAIGTLRARNVGKSDIRSLSVRFKFPGQAVYTVGSAAPIVKADGTFGWQRRAGKKLYVYLYFETAEVRSRVVTIQAR